MKTVVLRTAALVVVLLSTALAQPPGKAPGADAAIGRLFLTPQQRQDLDQRRGAATSDTGLPADLLPARKLPVRRLVLNGVVRGGREPLVWINGEPATALGKAVRVRSGPDRQQRVTLEVGRDGASARLKPGQAWEPATGTVHDCATCGQAPMPVPAGAEPSPAAAAQPVGDAVVAAADAGPVDAAPAAAQ